MNERLLVVGVDAGNGYTKIAFEGNQLLYPSLVSSGGPREMARLMDTPRDEDLRDMVNSQVKSLDVLISDMSAGTKEHYFCGSLAAQEGTPLSQWGDDKGMNKAATALVLAGLAAGIPENKALIYLAASLPVKNFTRFRDSYEKGLTGSFEVQFLSGPFQGVTKTLQIIRCRVYPEGLGVFIREIRDQGRKELLEGYQGLIAPGFRTTEYILFRDGKPVDELSGSLELGIASAHKRVGGKLSRETGLDYSEHELDDFVLRTPTGLLPGQIQAACQTEFRSLAEQIYSKLRIKWQDVWLKVNNFLVSDGGGMALFEGIQSVVKDSASGKLILVSNPVFATAEGNRISANLALKGGKTNGHQEGVGTTSEPCV